MKTFNSNPCTTFFLVFSRANLIIFWDTMAPHLTTLFLQKKNHNFYEFWGVVPLNNKGTMKIYKKSKDANNSISWASFLWKTRLISFLEVYKLKTMFRTTEILPKFCLAQKSYKQKPDIPVRLA